MRREGVHGTELGEGLRLSCSPGSSGIERSEAEGSSEDTSSLERNRSCMKTARITLLKGSPCTIPQGRNQGKRHKNYIVWSVCFQTGDSCLGQGYISLAFVDTMRSPPTDRKLLFTVNELRQLKAKFHCPGEVLVAAAKQFGRILVLFILARKWRLHSSKGQHRGRKASATRWTLNDFQSG